MPTHLGVKNVDSAAPRSIQVAETAFGKAISIARGKDGRLFIIEVAGGGAHPPILSGHFTRFSDAEDAVKKYVDSGNGRYTAAPTRSKLKMGVPPKVTDSAPVITFMEVPVMSNADADSPE